jgi:phage shock protein PspC (stress-responsive transcriptional regulator)
VRIVRAREGRLLGGVCAGLPDSWRLGANGFRLLFVITAFLGGLGVVAYLACWLVIPSETQDPDRDAVRGIVLLAWATGELVVLILIGLTAAMATVFGLGWVVFAAAAIITVAALSPLRARIPAVAALLTVGALTLPAMAVALSPLRLTLQSGESIVAPASYRALGRTVYRSGFGTLMIDLRKTPVAAGTDTTLRIDAGLRRTIVALPSNTCVRVHVNYDIHLFPAHLAALFTGRWRTQFHDVLLFDHPYGYGVAGGSHGSASSDSRIGGPLLTIDFTSQGGGLYVRDYPNSVDPELVPQWPGYPVALEPRPYLKNEPRPLRKRIVRDWRRRLVAERDSQLFVDRRLLGPCVGAISPPVGPSAKGFASTGATGTAVTGDTTVSAGAAGGGASQ